MILNKNLVLSLNQTITASAISENVIQWQANGIVPYEGAAIERNLGAGTRIPMLIQVTQDFATLTSLTIDLVSAETADLATNPETIGTSGPIPVASLVAGYRVPGLTILPDAVLKEYLGMNFTVTGSNATAGQVTAVLGTENQSA